MTPLDHATWLLETIRLFGTYVFAPIAGTMLFVWFYHQVGDRRRVDDRRESGESGEGEAEVIVRMGDQYLQRGFVQRFRVEPNGECFVTMSIYSDKQAVFHEREYRVEDVIKWDVVKENPEGQIVWKDGRPLTGSRWMESTPLCVGI